MDEAIVNASKGTALMDLFATFSKSCVEIQPLEGCQTFSLDRNSAQQHDAGYDSFITGVAFIGMVRRIGKLYFIRELSLIHYMHGSTFLHSWSGPMTLVVGLLHGATFLSNLPLVLFVSLIGPE